MYRYDVGAHLTQAVFRPFQLERALSTLSPLPLQSNPLGQKPRAEVSDDVAEYVFLYANCCAAIVALTGVAWGLARSVGPGRLPDWGLAFGFFLGWFAGLRARALVFLSRASRETSPGSDIALTLLATWALSLLAQLSLVTKFFRMSAPARDVAISLLSVSWPYLVGLIASLALTWLPDFEGGVLGVGTIGAIAIILFLIPGDRYGYCLDGIGLGLFAGSAISTRPGLWGKAQTFALAVLATGGIGVIFQNEPIAGLACGAVFGLPLAAVIGTRSNETPTAGYLLFGIASTFVVAMAYYIPLPRTTVLISTSVGCAAMLTRWREKRVWRNVPELLLFVGIACLFAYFANEWNPHRGQGGFAVTRNGLNQSFPEIALYIVPSFTFAFFLALLRIPMWLVDTLRGLSTLRRLRKGSVAADSLFVARRFDELVRFPIPGEARILLNRWRHAPLKTIVALGEWLHCAQSLELVDVERRVRDLAWRTVLEGLRTAPNDEILVKQISNASHLAELLPIPVADFLAKLATVIAGGTSSATEVAGKVREIAGQVATESRGELEALTKVLVMPREEVNAAFELDLPEQEGHYEVHVHKGGKLIVGDEINVSNTTGAVNIKSKLKDVNQEVSVTTLDSGGREEITRLLAELRKSLDAARSRPDDAERVAKAATMVEDEVKKEKPNRSFLDISAKGLLEAARAVADIAPVLLPTALKIAEFVARA